MPESECCDSVIDSLVERRKAAGMTQKQLAEATELTQSVIARLENKKAVPQLNTLLKIVMALGCSLELVPADNYTK